MPRNDFNCRYKQGLCNVKVDLAALTSRIHEMTVKVIPISVVLLSPPPSMPVTKWHSILVSQGVAFFCYMPVKKLLWNVERKQEKDNRINKQI